MRLYETVRRRGILGRAWARLEANGRQSRCAQTRREVEDFRRNYIANLERIARQLREERFRFSRAHGFAVERPGKSPRPIVVAPVASRLVQRAILDVIQGLPSFMPFLLAPYSFGGLPTRGVPQAIRVARKESESGGGYYLRSDIKEFFARIPREEVLARITPYLHDAKFERLLREAVGVELANLASLGRYSTLFPTHEIGVAQGNCLSVLLGNVLLSEFDAVMNGRGVTCLRYIDDILVLGPDRASVRKAFANGVHVLNDLGLTAYDPSEPNSKGREGRVRDGYEFLGCRVIPGLSMPTREAQQRIKSAIEQVLTEGERNLPGARTGGFDARRYSVAATAHTARHLVRGWVDQYSHCNDEAFRTNLDGWFKNRVQRYLARVQAVARDEVRYLRAIGFGLFADGKRTRIDPRGVDPVSSEVA
jgi:hypothetical protein